MARPESTPDFRWHKINPPSQDSYDQLTTRKLLGNQRVLDELFTSGLSADQKNKTTAVLDEIAGRTIDIVHSGGVTTNFGDLSLGLPPNLEQSNPEAFNLLNREVILDNRDLANYSWNASETYAFRGFVKPYRDFMVVRSEAYKDLFHNGRNIYLNADSQLRTFGRPELLVRFFRSQVVKTYEEAQVPHYIAPLTIVRQALFDICNELGLGQRDDIYRSLERKYWSLSLVDNKI